MSTIILDDIKIDKVLDESGNFWYCRHTYLNDSSYEYLEFAGGTEVWLKDGLWHREDGPARITRHGVKEWWLEGKLIRREVQN